MELTFSRLRANGLVSPLGVASSTIRLSWVAERELDTDGEIVVEVADRPSDLPLDSDAGVQVHTIASHARSFALLSPAAGRWNWRVGHRVAGEATWSETGHFTVAPDLADSARWVTHPDFVEGRPLDDARTVWFGIDITTEPTDTSTLLHLAVPGVADVRVDGHSTAQNLLGPGYSELRNEVSAATHDLGTLTPGPHTVTIEVASGPYWVAGTADRYAKFVGHYQAPHLLALVEQFDDTARSRTTPTAAGHTRTGRGATTASHWYGGEDFDAALPEPWHVGHAVDAIEPSDAAPTAPPTVWWPEHPPLAVVEVLERQQTFEGASAPVWDFGINVAGVPELQWQPASADRVVELRPAELVGASGADQDSTGSPIFDRVTIPAGSSGTWAPRFGYHGFRYVEVRGADETVELTAKVIRATNDSSGEFSSGDPFLQQLHDAIDRAVQGNMHSVFTDCPHREKLGWLEQLHFCFDAIARNYDVEAHLRDMLHHIRRAQLSTGAIPNIVPEFVDFSGHAFRGDDDAFRFDVNWGGVVVHLPLDHYREYGDIGVIEDNLVAMKRYLGYLRSREQNDLIDFGLGDWIALDMSAPRELVASHGYVAVLEAAEKIAQLVEDSEWSADLRERIAAVTSALHKYEQPSAEASQTELVVLLDLAERRGDTVGADRTYGQLLERISVDGDAFTVGEVTFELLVDALQSRGLGDFVYRTIKRSDVPGYGMQLARGVTALAETWSAERLAVGEGSNNHFMLGMIDHWLQRHVAGLRQSEDSIAWRTAIVSPTFLPDVPSASSTHSSPTGTYSVAWHRTEGSTVMVDVTVPFDGSARILIPGVPDHEVGHGHHAFVVDAVEPRRGESLVSAHD